MGNADILQSGEAEECILLGMKILDELKLRPLFSLGCYYLGELYIDIGQGEKALETLTKAEAAFQEMGMVHQLRRTKELLERVEAD